MSSKNADFPQFERVRDAALRALRPVKPAGQDTKAPQKLLFTAQRTDAGRRLPPHYLVYFLLVELLGFPDLGQFEKVAWSVPVDFKGRAFLIEHRKFGIGVFANSPEDEEDARQIVIRIQKAVKAAQPYFDWLAQEAVARSALNVLNNSSSLFDRFSYLLNIYRIKADGDDRRARPLPVASSHPAENWRQDRHTDPHGRELRRCPEMG